LLLLLAPLFFRSKQFHTCFANVPFFFPRLDVLFFAVFEVAVCEDEVFCERRLVRRGGAVLLKDELVVRVVIWVEASEDSGQDEAKVEVGAGDSTAFGVFAVGSAHFSIVGVEELESVVGGSLQFLIGESGEVGAEDVGAEGFDAFVGASSMQEMGKACRCCFLLELARGEGDVQFLERKPAKKALP